jgi:hypothetical protein
LNTLETRKESIFRSKDPAQPEDLMLVHGTLSTKLANIFQLKGISSIYYATMKKL